MAERIRGGVVKWVARCLDPFFVYYAEDWTDAIKFMQTLDPNLFWQVEIVPESWTHEEVSNA